MGLSASDRDPSADPGTDFYRFANGGWLDANPIPPGYGAWGAFEEASRRNEVVLRELLEQASAAARASGPRSWGRRRPSPPTPPTACWAPRSRPPSTLPQSGPPASSR